MLPRELSEEEFIKLLETQKSDVRLYTFAESRYKMYIVDDSPIMILEKWVCEQNLLRVHRKYLDYSFIDDVNKMIDKYTKKYGVDSDVVPIPYEVIVDRLKEFK